jgi:peptidoglycan/LPS O-acetylase OafA/YrhL
MRKIGEVSYSMYLLHFAVLAPSFRLAASLLPAGDWRTFLAHMAITTAMTFLLSCCTYRLIERPAVRWAARF